MIPKRSVLLRQAVTEESTLQLPPSPAPWLERLFYFPGIRNLRNLPVDRQGMPFNSFAESRVDLIAASNPRRVSIETVFRELEPQSSLNLLVPSNHSSPAEPELIGLNSRFPRNKQLFLQADAQQISIEPSQEGK
ncbi:hypothetical protein RRG08_028969 [Elysia crispata]|uniref:Uncharacterized protein n=1 Tax=Elysia crispata TaxID=231223 RepID=A0AAE1E2F7_9GAST|nr:hypothetical protein RRG08_028969 [Elysia crispata]